MSTDIYYFSGTGNSLFVAKELQKRISGSNIIPIAGLMKKTTIDSSADVIGFVFPVHALTIPIVVKKFIKKLNINNAKYIFAIGTRVGTVFYGFDKINQLLKRKNHYLSSYFLLNMCGNDSRHPNYIVPDEAKIHSLESIVLDKIERISDIVNNRRINHEKDNESYIKTSSNPFIEKLLDHLVIFLMDIAEYFGGANYWYHDVKCNGCGTCENVCPSSKIIMNNKRPVWQKRVLCYMCFACLNFCPKKSVQVYSIPGVKSDTINNGRYSHPYATITDISNQKNL